MFDPKKIILNNPISDTLSHYIKLTRNGNEFEGLCPFHNEKTPSFSVVPEKGFYHCFGCGAHGDVIDFIKNYFSVDFKEACEILGGEKIAPNVKPKKKAPVEIKNLYEDLEIQHTCKTILEPGTRTPKIFNVKRQKYINYIPSLVHEYIRKDGTLAGYVVRIDIDGKKKILMPIQDVKNKDGEIIPAIIPFKKPRMLYNIGAIRSSGNIFIVEGEKTADAFKIIFGEEAQVIAWVGGTNGIDKSKFNDLPPNRKYILIPDADEVGFKAMESLAKILPTPERVKIVKIEGRFKGWDIADALAEGMMEDEVKDLLKNNLDITPKPEPEPEEQDTTPEPSPFNPEKFEETLKEDFEEAKKEPPIDVTESHFRCLGFSGKNQFFFHKTTGQVYSFKGSEISSKTTLITLAPLSWWQKMFPKSTKGRSWDFIGDMLIRKNEKIGFYNSELLRNRGAYLDGDRPVLHLGNKILCEGKAFTPDTFDSEYIYKRSLPLSLMTGSPLVSDEAKRLIQLCRMARWEQNYFGNILAGWIFSSLVCGVMPFRSHLYLIGASGSGKSWVMENIVKKVMGNMPIYCTSKTTEPGIRKNLRGDVRPIIFNEAEAELAADVLRMQAVFDLSRQASDENAFAILKGSGEDGESYTIRSSFMFASINRSMDSSADTNRTCFISLGVPPVDSTPEERLQDNTDFKLLENFSDAIVTKEFVGGLLTRAVKLIPQMRKNHSVFADAGAKIFGTRRKGEQMAMILSGLYSLENDDYVSEDDALTYINEMSITTDKDAVEKQSQERQALDNLLFFEFKILDLERKNRTIFLNKALFILGEQYSEFKSTNGIDVVNLINTLEGWGVKYFRENVYFSTNPECLANQAFKKTLWASGWIEALKRLQGVTIIKKHYFTPFFNSPAISIPMKHFINKNENND